MIDLSSLEKAITSLTRAVVRSQASLDDSELRDAVIQRFEYTYELCWKMLKRTLEKESPTPAQIDSLSYRDLLRDAAEKGMITDVAAWFVYRDHRNLTSHIYDEDKAKVVFKTACNFLNTATELLRNLQSRSS